jgi:hypothetical protein
VRGMKGESDMILVEREVSYERSVWRKIIGALRKCQTTVADQMLGRDSRAVMKSSRLAVGVTDRGWLVRAFVFSVHI